MTQDEQFDERFSELLRGTVWPAGRTPAPRDLWPRMRERIERPRLSWSWLDAALAAAAVLGCALAPQAWTIVFAHL